MIIIDWDDYITSTGCLIEPDVFYGGSEIINEVVDNEQACATLAFCTAEANFWTYQLRTKSCSVKRSNSNRRASQVHVSGSAQCAGKVQRLQRLKQSKRVECVWLRLSGSSTPTMPQTTPTIPTTPLTPTTPVDWTKVDFSYNIGECLL